MVINVLVNSPSGSVFLESYDASNSSTDSNKMFNLSEKTIMKVGQENVVQVVTDSAIENKKAVFGKAVRIHAYINQRAKKFGKICQDKICNSFFDFVQFL